MIDLRSLPERWNDSRFSRLATLPENSSSHAWPMVGMFAMGLVVGVVGCFAISQRSQIKRFAMGGEDWSEYGDAGDAEPVSGTTHRENNRRKATTEVNK